MTSRRRAAASRRTSGATPCALKMARAPTDRRAERAAPPQGPLANLLHEDGARLAQFVHDVLVVNDFLAHVNRRSVEVERDFDHIDGPHHTRTESARLEQIHLLFRAVIGGYGFQWHVNVRAL